MEHKLPARAMVQVRRAEVLKSLSCFGPLGEGLISSLSLPDMLFDHGNGMPSFSSDESRGIGPIVPDICMRVKAKARITSAEFASLPSFAIHLADLEAGTVCALLDRERHMLIVHTLQESGMGGFSPWDSLESLMGAVHAGRGQMDSKSGQPRFLLCGDRTFRYLAER
jgi:hypothetical protein